MSADVEWKGLRASVWFDDRDPRNRGWYAEYMDDEGTFSDSEKIWEGERMPTRRDASTKAHHLALQALKAEAKRRAVKAKRYGNPNTDDDAEEQRAVDERERNAGGRRSRAFTEQEREARIRAIDKLHRTLKEWTNDPGEHFHDEGQFFNTLSRLNVLERELGWPTSGYRYR